MDELSSLQQLFDGLPEPYCLDPLETVILILQLSDDPSLIAQAASQLRTEQRTLTTQDLHSLIEACLANDSFINVATPCLWLIHELGTLSPSEHTRLRERASRELVNDPSLHALLLDAIA